MGVLKYTLIADGSSDKALMNIIKWLLDDLFPELPNEGAFADFRNLPKPPTKENIAGQVKYASLYHPSDILFYHRDAESNSNTIIEERITEIKKQLNPEQISRTICVIPIKMTETWLLFDETAIKKAAGNRNFTGKTNLPTINKLENLNDPKLFLHNLLKNASGLKSRNLKNFNVHNAVHLVAENIENFSPLRKLSSFNRFESDLKKVVNELMTLPHL
jgi:hypothetical protein